MSPLFVVVVAHGQGVMVVVEVVVMVVVRGQGGDSGDDGGMLRVVIVSSALTGGKYLPLFCRCRECGDLEKI